MRESGFINIPRDFRIKVESLGRNTGKIFYYIVSEAKHEDVDYSCNGHIYELKRGQAFINSTKARKDLEWIDGNSKKTLSRKEFLGGIDIIKNAGLIKTKTEIRGSIITVENYNIFQPLTKSIKTAGDDKKMPRANNTNGFDGFKKSAGDDNMPAGDDNYSTAGDDKKMPRANNTNGFDGFKKSAGDDKKFPQGTPFINEEKPTSVSYGSLYNTNNYSFSMSETENAENFNDNFNETEQDMIPEYDNEFEEIVRQYEREKRDLEGYSFDPDEEDLEDNCDDME